MGFPVIDLREDYPRKWLAAFKAIETRDTGGVILDNGVTRRTIRARFRPVRGKPGFREVVFDNGHTVTPTAFGEWMASELRAMRKEMEEAGKG